jgi:hypothetical protein
VAIALKCIAFRRSYLDLLKKKLEINEMKKIETLKTASILIIFALLFSCSKNNEALNEASGTETGNGGGVVVCRDPETQAIQSVELLDFYEAKVIQSRVLDMGEKTIPWTEKIETVFKKLDRLSPTRSKKYRKIYERFFNEAKMIPNANLTYIDDAANIVLPLGCTKEQASILKTPEFPGEKRYTMSQFLWDKMDNDSKAGLILHEIIYQEGLAWDHKNSKPTRFLTGLLTSTEINQYTPDLFSKLVLDIGFYAIDFYGTMISENKDQELREDTSDFFSEVRPAEIKYKDFELVKGFTIGFYKNSVQPYYIFGVKKWSNTLLKISSNSSSGTYLFFSPQGKITKIFGASDESKPHEMVELFSIEYKQFSLKLFIFDFSQGPEIDLDSNEFPIVYRGIVESTNEGLNYLSSPLYGNGSPAHKRMINQNGIILEGYPAQTTQLFNSPQGFLNFTRGSSWDNSGIMYFDENGIAISGTLAPDQSIKTKQGLKKILNKTEVTFDKDGLAQSKDFSDGGDKDREIGGCKLSNYEESVKNYLLGGFGLKEILNRNKILWLPESLTVSQAETVITRDDFDYRTGHPAFHVTFNDKAGNKFRIQHIYAGYSSHFEKPNTNLLLKPEAILVTERNNIGEVTKRYCEHDLSDIDDSRSLQVINETIDQVTSIEIEPFATQIIEEIN